MAGVPALPTDLTGMAGYFHLHHGTGNVSLYNVDATAQTMAGS